MELKIEINCDYQYKYDSSGKSYFDKSREQYDYDDNNINEKFIKDNEIINDFLDKSRIN